MSHPARSLAWWMAVLLGATGPAGAALTPEQVEFFESRIRPVLAQDCYECHRSGGKQKGGLALDHRAAVLEGGDSGAVIVPGRPEESLLMRAIRHEVKDLEMPKAGAKLEDGIIADFEKWITMGAPDPRDAPSSEAEVAGDTDWSAVMERRKSWWSFGPVAAPEIPPGDAAHPVDRFVGQRLAKEGLEPAERADRRTLIRRLSFALRGLPPSPEESEMFVRDEQPGAYEALVDRYLASPQFGERWARHWMDWLRYADSHGSEGDPGIPHAWRYRDYLIRALNADVPYDQLVREHVAGDLLEAPRLGEGRNESAIGTAHLRMVFHGFAPTDALDELVRFTDDQIAVLTKGFMALTVSCARCHDHKFDAISQADYYALFGILASTKPGMVTTEVRGTEDVRRRARMAELKNGIREKLAAHWVGAAGELEKRLANPEAGLLEKAGDANHVLHPVQAASAAPDVPDAIAKARAAWEGRLAELRSHRERTYGYEWDFGPGGAAGTTHGPSAGTRQAAGSFEVAREGDAVVRALYPAGVYSHLASSKDAGVAISPRSRLDGSYELWARVAGDDEAAIRYVVQNYPRDGTVYPVANLKGGGWRWQKWNLNYWEGDHVHLEVTTAPEQAVLARDRERSWFGIREAVLVRKGEPTPPEVPLDFVEPLLEAMEAGAPADRASLAAVYAKAIRTAAERWKRGSATDGQALLLQELLGAGLLPNQPGGIAGMEPLLAEYRKLEAEIVAPERVPGLWEADSFDQPLFVRGNHKQPADPVPRRFLEAIDPTPYEPAGSGRRELAEDFLRPDNPFTSRVIVNRIWHHLFGRGLVATTDNFGRLGEKPTHPELLDYLAASFVKDGWSIKKAIRSLVLSDAWCRSSVPSVRASETDPDNRLLSHFRVHRLEAEAIRDNLLEVAGELDNTLYGAPVSGGTPRRSVYVGVRRNNLDPFLSAFDVPAPASTVGRREVTNVPAQSLTLLNSDFVLGLADRWAGRVPEGSAEERVRRMMERALGRAATSAEVAEAVGFVKAMAEQRRRGGEERESIQRALADGETKLKKLDDGVRARILAGREKRPEGSAAAGPAPLAFWDFEGSAEDRVGGLHATLHGDAKIVEGALVVGGDRDFASTVSLPKEVRAATLEARVQLNNLEQRGGGVMSLQTIDGANFNGIVFAESEAGRWLAGSEKHNRTSPFGGPPEQAAQREPVHVAITWAEDGTITCYRNGERYGEPIRPGQAKHFVAGTAQVLFGCRHGAPGADRLLQGRLLEARLYDRALAAEEVAASAARDTSQFVSEGDLLAAMSEAERAERESLLAERKRREAELASTDRPNRPANEWADFAHALFNLKEFIYVR